MEKRVRILFVDDDELLGETMVTTLELMGYEARAETNPRKALRDFAKEPEGFDAVVLDYSMPDIDGLELARWLSTIRPELPMILLTGYPENISGRKTEEVHIRAVLSKPITRPELTQALGSLFPAPPELTHSFLSLQTAIVLENCARGQGSQETDC